VKVLYDCLYGEYTRLHDWFGRDPDQHNESVETPEGGSQLRGVESVIVIMEILRFGLMKSGFTETLDLMTVHSKMRIAI
jgi:hypothetical protein